MPNLNTLIITAAEYKVALSIPGSGVYMIQTMNNISWSDTAENELIYAVGEENPIGNKRNANKYSGKFALQAGEMYNILQAAGLKTAIQVPSCILSITSISGGPQYTYSGLCLNSSGVDVKAKDKESVVSIDWTAISVN